MTAPGATAPQVFISYRRQETAGHAGRLYDAMSARFGEPHVFVDVDLAPGIDFVERITEAVAACQVLIVVMGPTWATVKDEQGTARIADPEDFVRLEVETALRRPDVTPIPVLVSGARMPSREVLPPEVQPITRRNALELSDQRWRYDVGRLINTLDQLLAEMPVGGSESSPERSVATEKAAPPSMGAPTTSAKSKSAAPWAGGGRLRWALLGALAIAAIVVAVVLTAGGGDGNGAAEGGDDTSANQETTEYQTLLNSLPASFRGNCRNDPGQQWMVEDVGARAQANCEVVGKHYLTYGLWGSPSGARDWVVKTGPGADARPCSNGTKNAMQMILPQAARECLDVIKKGESAEGITFGWNEDRSRVGGFFQSVDNHDQEVALKQWEQVIKAR
jgi:TIR domain